MFPAARLTDPITHDMLVPSGVISYPAIGRIPTVIIENMPAAVMTDFVTCSGATSAGPAHPPMAGPPPAFMPPPPCPPIILGKMNVLVQNKPLARWVIDSAGCGTFLGDPKLMATRTTLVGP
ncbi:MAG: hypothetical protein AB8B60_17235 [Sulfitobacter sp.]